MNRYLAGIVCSCAALAAAGCGERALGPAPPFPDSLSAVIDRPTLQSGEQQYGPVVVFGWRCEGGEKPLSTRYLSSSVIDTNGVYNPAFDVIRDLNADPARYESMWSEWRTYGAADDSSRTAVIGDDETLTPGRHYVFAVQARDASGAATDTFVANENVRRFRIKASTGPFLRIYEPYLVGFRFIGTNLRAEERELPPGVPLNFKWLADASDYRGEISGYRFGWDVPDPASWDAPFVEDLASAPTVSFSAGTHTLFVEAIDRAGARALGRVTIRVVSWPMDRNLLLVDDFAGASAPFPDYAMPSEAQDDEFWSRICARADGFDPARDVHDCLASGSKASAPGVLGRYKNVIWNYSSGNNEWGASIRFTPESLVGTSSRYDINYLSIFLMRGGHVWTLGSSEGGGGLAAMLSGSAQIFPMSVEYEVLGNLPSYGGARNGVSSMAYRDYCVTVLDKVDARFRTDAGMRVRIRDHRDVLVRAHRERADALSAAAPEFPERLELWEEVTKPGRRFNPDDTLGPGGLTYVEAYDPAYWMAARRLSSQLCFRPLYLMEAKNGASPLDGGAVALWLVKYEGVTPQASTGPRVAAPSVHFGFPLWFFRRSAADSVADAIFARWGISRTP
jgi:hypothetical protein